MLTHFNGLGLLGHGPLTVRPRVNVLEDEDGFRLVGDFPGVVPEDFDVRLERGRLVLEATRKDGEEVVGRYRQAFRLPDGLDLDKLEAHLENGVLTLTLPKGDGMRKRTIPVVYAS